MAYVLSEADKNALARLLSKDASAPPRPGIYSPPQQAAKSPDGMWALPPCETGLPAARLIGEKIVPTGISCCLWHYKDGNLEAMLDPVGNPVREVVYNHYGERTNELVQIWRHRDGTWANERPAAPVVTTLPNATTTTTIAPSPCAGDCIYTANSSLEWTGPTGGCAGTTTTTSTTTTSTTTTSTTSTTSTTEAPACASLPCRLICVDTGTTPAPVDGIVPPYTRYLYEVVGGQDCVSPCECYGAGDPCFLEDGEIVSQCLNFGTTTTTAAPPVYTPCELAEIYYGPVEPGESRFAALPGKPDTWEICQTCQLGEYTQYEILDQTIASIYDTKVVVASQPCLKDPCQDFSGGELLLTAGNTVWAAYNYTEQLAGAIPAHMIVTGTRNTCNTEQLTFKPYWRKCKNCPDGKRDTGPPPEMQYVYPESVKAAGCGFFLESLYYEKTIETQQLCAEGPDCGNCTNAPLPTTTTGAPPTSTTTSTTTTLAPCSCPPPAFCPTVTGQCTSTVCQRGGSALPGALCGSTTTPAPNTCFDGTKWRYCPTCEFVDNTTTTAGPTTTLGPCTGTIEYICVHGVWQQGVSTCTAACSPFWCDQADLPVDSNGLCTTCGDTETRNCGICTTTTTSTTTQAPCGGSCPGECKWQAGLSSGGILPDGPFFWQINENGCGCGCGCHTPPANPPETACDFAYTACESDLEYVPCCCTTPAPCNKTCTWNATDGVSWSKIIDPCAATCPCPVPNRAPNSTCDTYTVKCNDGPPTTTTTSTTTTSTTAAPEGACCLGGGCSLQTSASCATNGGTYLGNNSNCAGCIGACCYNNGFVATCSLSYAGGCDGPDYTFLGFGTFCGSGCTTTTTTSTTTTSTTTTSTTTTTTTAAPTGACCYDNHTGGGCVVVTAAVCATLSGGVYQGNGVACSSACMGLFPPE